MPLPIQDIKPASGGSLMLAFSERGERLAVLLPRPRRHRRRYYGVLAADVPLGRRSRLPRAGRGVRIVKRIGIRDVGWTFHHHDDEGTDRHGEHHRPL